MKIDVNIWTNSRLYGNTQFRTWRSLDGYTPLSFIYLEKARQSFFSQTVEAKNMADF